MDVLAGFAQHSKANLDKLCIDYPEWNDNYLQFESTQVLVI